jgi:outer membrane lipoprotein carrier protein
MWGGLAYTLSVWAGSLELPVVIQRVQQRYEETVTLQADFQQTSFIKTAGETQRSRGKVFIKKPGMMRWEYQQGGTQLLVTDGEFLWFYLPEEKQAIKEQIGQIFSARAPTLFLAGKGKLEEIFDIESVEEQQTYPALKLFPKEPHPTLQELVLHFDPQTWNIVESRIIDFVGNVTTLRFTNILVNGALSPGLFRFEPPPGTEVIIPSHTLPR